MDPELKCLKFCFLSQESWLHTLHTYVLSSKCSGNKMPYFSSFHYPNLSCLVKSKCPEWANKIFRGSTELGFVLCRKNAGCNVPWMGWSDCQLWQLNKTNNIDHGMLLWWFYFSYWKGGSKFAMWGKNAGCNAVLWKYMCVNHDYSFVNHFDNRLIIVSKCWV